MIQRRGPFPIEREGLVFRIVPGNLCSLAKPSAPGDGKGLAFESHDIRIGDMVFKAHVQAVIDTLRHPFIGIGHVVIQGIPERSDFDPVSPGRMKDVLYKGIKSRIAALIQTVGIDIFRQEASIRGENAEIWTLYNIMKGGV